MNKTVTAFVILIGLFTVTVWAEEPCDCKCPGGCIDRQAAIDYFENYIQEYPDLTEQQIDVLRVQQGLQKMILKGEKPEWFENMARVAEHEMQVVFSFEQVLMIYEEFRLLKRKCD